MTITTTSLRPVDTQTAAPQVPGFPVNLNLEGRRVLVVGGGAVAARKVAALKSSGADVTVVAPNAVTELAYDTEIRWLQRPYRTSDTSNYRMVITATDDPLVNAQVAQDGEAANIFVNAADDPANCSMTLMSVLRRGDLQVTVSTNGRSPALARWLRRRLEHEIDSSFAELLDLLAEVREEAKTEFGTSEVSGWNDALDDGLIELIRDSQTDKARNQLRHHLGLNKTYLRLNNP